MSTTHDDSESESDGVPVIPMYETDLDDSGDELMSNSDYGPPVPIPDGQLFESPVKKVLHQHLSKVSGLLPNAAQASTSQGADKVDIFTMANITPSGFPMPIAELCNHIRNSPPTATAHMQSLVWYKELRGVQHEFLLVEVVQHQDDNSPIWIRLERAAKTDYKHSRTFFQRLWQQSHSLSSIFPANDSALISSSWEKATGPSHTRTIKHIRLSSQTTLKSLEQLLTAFCDISVNYSLLEQNCWFFCSVIVENLMGKFGHAEMHGKILHQAQGKEARKRIREQFEKVESKLRVQEDE